MTIQNTARAAIEAKAILILAGAKHLKGQAQKAAQEAAELLHAKGDRMALAHPELYRSHQVAMAMVDAITSKRIPQHCNALAQRIAGSARTLATA